MIRINLSGAPKPKKGKRGGPVPIAGEGPNFLVVLLVILGITAAANGYWYVRIQKEQKRIADAMVKAENRGRQLLDVKKKYEERQKQAENYKRRVDVIDQLRANQAGPVNLLTMVGDTVNTTDAVWLNTMKDDGHSISLDGVALSVHAVANLITNLQKTGYFKTVEIKESYQDEGFKDMQAFVFSIVCEKQKS